MELTASYGNTKLAIEFYEASLQLHGCVHLKYKVIVEIKLMDVLFVVENLVKLDILPQALGLVHSLGHGDPIHEILRTVHVRKLWMMWIFHK